MLSPRRWWGKSCKGTERDARVLQGPVGHGGDHRRGLVPDRRPGAARRRRFLFICGRVKSLIVTPNGKYIYPEEVENEILKSPYVAEVVVYTHKSGQVSEEVRALVRPNPEALDELAEKQGKSSLSEGEVETLIRREVSGACEKLASYKRVKRVTISNEEFPKTTTRKVKRFEVEALMTPSTPGIG